MQSLMQSLFALSRRTDIPRLLSLPRDTVVQVNGRSFRLVDPAMVEGTPDDYVCAIGALPVRKYVPFA